METNPEFGKRTPKYCGMTVPQKMDDEIYEADIKTNFRKNHIRIV